MDAAPSPVDVATALPAPPPQWPARSQWIEPPGDLSVHLSSPPGPAWSRSAQGAAALFLLLALVLLGWHAGAAQRWGCRPTMWEAGPVPSPCVDLNQADGVQLMQLPGVGENLARRIEAYRVQHHGFRTVDELRQVGGIGPKLLAKLRPHICVEAPASDEDDEAAAQPAHPVAAKTPKEKPLPVVSRKEPPTRPIDVNHATTTELQCLPGIGPTLSQRIVKTREERPFRSVEELRRVRGIGTKTLERLRPYVVVVP